MRALAKDDRGFTLPEMMVTIMVMIVVLFALYNVFDASIRVFGFGNDKVEATEAARLGLEKMERELRSAYPYDNSDALTTNDHLFFSTTAPGTGARPSTTDQVTFGNDRSAVGSTGYAKLQCGTPCEYVTYKLTSTVNPANACTAATAPCTLRRVNTSNSADAGDPLVDNVVPGGLTFTYLKKDGTALVSTDGESAIGRVLVRLSVSVNGRTQVLTTNVDLRNRFS